jgi:SpoVK/Ycf46/Vps4 family AAA+-type ATPase
LILQGNEAEALRSWKSALDGITYFKAYKLPFNYQPKSETEKALYDSLRQLEDQCKERVDLLETLRISRQDIVRDTQEEKKSESGRRRLEKARSGPEHTPTPDKSSSSSWLGDETVRPMQMSELPTPTPALPPRPSILTSRSSERTLTKETSTQDSRRQSSSSRVPSLPVPTTKVSRSPSPEHGRKTMRTTLRPEKKGFRKYRSAPNRDRLPDTMRAAGLAWEAQPRLSAQANNRPESDPSIEARLSATAARRSIDQDAASRPEDRRRSNPIPASPAFEQAPQASSRDYSYAASSRSSMQKSLESLQLGDTQSNVSVPNLIDLDSESDRPPPPVPPHALLPVPALARTRPRSPAAIPKAPDIVYRKEYPARQQRVPPTIANNILDKAYQRNDRLSPSITRKPVANTGATLEIRGRSPGRREQLSESEEEAPKSTVTKPRRPRTGRTESAKTITPPSTDAESLEEEGSASASEKKMAKVLKNLPKGLDENSAKQILNEIVVKGDEVHWEDVAGLEAAKKALKEAVVYPFLRPDLFMGLREPARGMLLFGPPGTGKTMLARAVATESKSTFFAISASSLTSKWHGESEKLVRALFAMAKALAPSIIFVDEIDSLLSSRSGSSEHEASRRSKTEFLIQWSDLQRAAAGKDTTVGDASRVLVLAATNCPWDIDEAARRRFVRRQYIPLPEKETRETQIRTLLGHQKHELNGEDIERLVELTEGSFA